MFRHSFHAIWRTPLMELVDTRNNERLEEELIVEQARKGDPIAQEILIKKYKNFVRSKARSYFLIGADREDIVQESLADCLFNDQK